MKRNLFGPVMGLVLAACFATPSANAFTLHNFQTGLCLGVAAGNPASGTALVTWTCDGTSSQQWWQIIPTMTPYADGTTGIYKYSEQYSNDLTSYVTDFNSAGYFYLSSDLAIVTKQVIIPDTYVNAYSQLDSTDLVGVVQPGNYSTLVNYGFALTVMSRVKSANQYLGKDVFQQWQAVLMGYDFSGHACYVFANYANTFFVQPLVMGVQAGKTNRGAPVIIWPLIVDANGNADYHGHPDQYWCVY